MIDELDGWRQRTGAAVGHLGSDSESAVLSSMPSWSAPPSTSG